MAKHFYEIGDTAYIKGDLSMDVQYVSPWMIKKKGKKVTIRTKQSSGRIPYYYLEGMEGSWTEEMLDPTNNTLHKKSKKEKQEKLERLERFERRTEEMFDGQGIIRIRDYEDEVATSAIHRWDSSPYFFTGDRDRDRGMRRSMSFVSPQPFSISDTLERPSSDLSFSLDYNADWFRGGAEANTTVVIEEE